MALKENDLKWFRPLWRRVAVAVFLLLWLGWELFFTRDSFWALLVGAALAYVAWNFFYAFPKEQPDDALPPAGSADDKDRQDP
ncbi:DUF3329 domain-containing protein [uncultured Devosia sp.]|uniref:DUF3329 domain-containing protein n=1 Tax=uncultured Devosia sp. TaxID=211434 RepID=UPI00260FFD7E|nr:DUF3329 domain-containing protein [uncultured Devosia sp.]